jgi:hypothetical protein
MPNNNNWSAFKENIMIDYCDKSMCFRYLHTKSNRYYNKLHLWLIVPVIFMSTITGVANYSQTRIPVEKLFYYNIVIGTFNILTSFLAIISQLLKVPEKIEGHRFSALSWDKLSRNIRVELTKVNNEREDAETFITRTKESYDVLLELSPHIKKLIIRKFNKEYKDSSFYKPEICNSLTSVKESVYRSFKHDISNKYDDCRSATIDRDTSNA